MTDREPTEEEFVALVERAAKEMDRIHKLGFSFAGIDDATGLWSFVSEEGDTRIRAETAAATIAACEAWRRLHPRK